MGSKALNHCLSGHSVKFVLGSIEAPKTSCKTLKFFFSGSFYATLLVRPQTTVYQAIPIEVFDHIIPKQWVIFLMWLNLCTVVCPSRPLKVTFKTWHIEPVSRDWVKSSGTNNKSVTVVFLFNLAPNPL